MKKNVKTAWKDLMTFRPYYIPEGFNNNDGYEPGDEKATFFSEIYLYYRYTILFFNIK